MKKFWPVVLLCFACSAFGGVPDPLAAGFERPPESAKPWTYWFWMNGNITREGITADLEAMARVGIHGVLIMEVARPKQMAPPGPVAFASPAWRELFLHAVAEAGRLGMEINMNNDAGWTGSGGPWITPEFSMQKLVSTSITVSGPAHCDTTLPPPPAVQQFYRDIKVLAYPASASPPPAPAVTKKGKARAAKTAGPVTVPVAPAKPVPPDRIIDLTSRMDRAGKLSWDVPEGNWIVQRIGHTSTGRVNHPAPEAGTGLECDKFSAEAVTRHYRGFIEQLADAVGPAGRNVLTSTHIDSWEVGVQNWTPRMAEEFSRRRGYDLTPWLVSLDGGPPVGSAELTRRFHRDFKRTQSELTTEAYAGTLRALANRRGLELSIEAYGPTGEFINSLDYATAADVPMGEFWVMRWGAWHLHSSRLVASTVHAEGRSLVGAESFTATGENGSWTEHPYSIKTVGDWALTEGINRFVFHRTAMQPWSGYEPGMTFGPHGTHFDRNQTWWEPGRAFMQYLARCQFLLQQGLFVADVCRLVPDGEEHGSSEGHGTSLGMNALPRRFAPLPPGCNFDYLSEKFLSDRTKVVNGRITLPSGMSYRVMQLPEDRSLAPEILQRLRDLVRAGAIIAGPRPDRSPSLQNYPRCDDEVKSLAAELWGDCDGRTVTEHALGAGRVHWGKPMSEVLRGAGREPDFTFTIDPALTDDAIMSVTLGRGKTTAREPPGLMPTSGLNWIHRRVGGAEIYFVANPQHRPVEARCSFRVDGTQPELWNPETGERLQTAVFVNGRGRTELPVHFTPAGSVFVVFRAPTTPAAQVVSVKRDGAVLFSASEPRPKSLPAIVRDNASVQCDSSEPGRYEFSCADGRTQTMTIGAPAAALILNRPWQVRFQPGRGAPAGVEFAKLADWTQHADDGIRHFSGTATYVTHFDWQPAPVASAPRAREIHRLELGRVEVMAEVRLNGVDLGVLWKPPFIVDVTRALRAGRNELEVKVTNLWVNRLIGDERYPDDCTSDGSWKTGPIPAWPEWFLRRQPRPEPRRLTFTTWKYYAADTPLVPSGLIGPVTLRSATRTDLGPPNKVATAANASTPFQPTWESLQRYTCPDWFRDAKFGIYTHWGVYSVPQFSTEWYSRNMYQPAHKAHAHHVETFGPVDQFGYKDFIPRFTAEKFNADEWAELFRRAGAKFAGPVAEHADGFAMWDSALTKWDAKDMGPKRDVVGELEKAIRRRGLKFATSLHHSWLWGWYATSDATADVHDPRYAEFYGRDLPVSAFRNNPEPPPDEAFCDRWLAKTTELIDRYNPDLLYFDTKLNILPEPYRLEMASHYYNHAAQRRQPVVLTYKKEDLQPGSAVLDVERGRMAAIQPSPWMTDTSVARNSWGYVADLEYYTTDRLVHDLVDIVSKNGCLLLNVAPRPDGTIPDEQRARLLAIGRWLDVNGEAIYGTRPWRVFGEGPTQIAEGSFGDLKLKDFTAEDVRFTTKGDALYAIALGWPGAAPGGETLTRSATNTLAIHALGRKQSAEKVTSVRLIGHRGELKFTQTDEALAIELPSARPGEYAYSFKIARTRVR